MGALRYPQRLRGTKVKSDFWPMLLPPGFLREPITPIPLKARKKWFWMVPSRKLTNMTSWKITFLSWDTSSNGWLSIVMLVFRGYNNSRLKSYKRPQKERIGVFQANHLFSGAEPVKLQGCITHVTSDKKKSGEHKIWDRLFSLPPKKGGIKEKNKF